VGHKHNICYCCGGVKRRDILTVGCSQCKEEHKVCKECYHLQIPIYFKILRRDKDPRGHSYYRALIFRACPTRENMLAYKLEHADE